MQQRRERGSGRWTSQINLNQSSSFSLSLSPYNNNRKTSRRLSNCRSGLLFSFFSSLAELKVRRRGLARGERRRRRPGCMWPISRLSSTRSSSGDRWEEIRLFLFQWKSGQHSTRNLFGQGREIRKVVTQIFDHHFKMIFDIKYMFYQSKLSRWPWHKPWRYERVSWCESKISGREK